MNRLKKIKQAPIFDNLVINYIMKKGKFSGIYRIDSARAPWWNYGDNASYFITICTARFRCILGDIRNGQITLSPVGEVVGKEWAKSFVIRQEINCEAFVIMPNHIHAIITLKQKKRNVKHRQTLPGRAQYAGRLNPFHPS